MKTPGPTRRCDALWRRLGVPRPELRAWAMYDWANSAYATTIMAAVLPPFFSRYYAASLDPAAATRIYALAVSGSLLVSAVLSPVLGALSDLQRSRKRWLFVFTAVGVAATFLLALVRRDAWVAALAVLFAGHIGFSGGQVFYDALLRGTASEAEIDRVSAAGYALGYVGGGLLLALQAAVIFRPALAGLPDAAAATRCALASVGVWWAVFSLPLFRRVPEPPGVPGDRPSLAGALAQLAATFRRVRDYRDLLLFLAAFWFYNNGIGTIIVMATIYGAEIGIATPHLVLALLITQFVAFPFSLLFGQLGGRLGVKPSIQLALAVYVVITVRGYFMRSAADFYVLAALVGTVQGGAQALSRSLFARMVPPRRAGEFFGFFSVAAKVAAILGPVLFAAVSAVTGGGRGAVLAIAVLFAAGMALLATVNVERGESAARGSA